MPGETVTVVVAEPDATLAEWVADYLTRALPLAEKHPPLPCQVDVRTTLTLGEVEDELQACAVDVLLAADRFPDGLFLPLLGRAGASRPPAVFVVTAEPRLGSVLEMMRLGVREVLVRPFDLSRVARSIDASLREVILARRSARRQRRLLRLTHRLLMERRQLRGQIEMLARDIVSAYADLARQVSAGRAEPGAG